MARSSSLSSGHDHSQVHHTRYDSPGGVVNPTDEPLPENAQQSQETDIHAPGGIRTRHPSQASGRRPHALNREDRRQVIVLEEILTEPCDVFSNTTDFFSLGRGFKS
jgi:hypothetical protein